MGSFRFKQFEVEQNHSAMKVNTDAVLLGAWMSVPGGEDAGVVDTADDAASAGVAGSRTVRALDIGTGTGVIALMAGQRLAEAGVSAHIDAVEIDADACQDAAANFDSAPWDRISFGLHNVPLQEFSGSGAADGAAGAAGYDLIFSNPPYFISSLKNDSQAKTTARHTDTLSQRELLFYSTPLLKEGGTLAIILPVVEGEELLRKVEFMADVAVAAGGDTAALFPSRICYVHTVERKPAKRLMLEFVKCAPSNCPTMRREQLVMMSGGASTPEYAELVGGFYLR
ncbi:MAG: methyltransferase [Bacteroidales bacterium]|nr:methyltransferase [Bacteroidales bacterium]